MAGASYGFAVCALTARSFHMAVSTEQLTRQKTSARETLRLGIGVKVWHLIHFGTAQEAVSYAQVPPIQVAGEFGMTDSDRGGVDGYYFF
jgi:hypothetical protein